MIDQHENCRVKWSLLTLFLLVVLAVCVYIVFQRHLEKDAERNSSTEYTETFFPKEAPLYIAQPS